MRPDKQIYINALNLICALGDHREQILGKLINGESGIHKTTYATQRSHHLGQVSTPLEQIELGKKFNSRNNQLLHSCLFPLFDLIGNLIEEFGRQRIGVVLGTSTSGISNAEQAIRQFHLTSAAPVGYSYHQQQMSSPSDYIVELFSLEGPSYTISTACSSAARALISAAEWLKLDICDAVICGGCDTLCQLTVDGFKVLDAVSSELCDPFGAERKGTNLGEGCGLFVLTRKKADLMFSGGAGSSDAYHFSAPDPSGVGAMTAMSTALQHAGLEPNEIDYINLHGTGTIHNDQMEAKAITELFNQPPVCSSTKSLTGHALGAAGAVEAAIICYILQQENDYLPVHLMQSDYDPDLPNLELVRKEKKYPQVNHCMSNSFAFGGSNCSLILSRTV